MDARRTSSLTRLLLIAVLPGIACSPATADWRQVTGVPPWAPRTDQAAVVFKDKMWLLGGASRGDVPPGRVFNDVWYSSDGERWALATADAAWAPRREHVCVAFHDKLWIIGGKAPDQSGATLDPTNDIWCSSDGMAWSQVTVVPPWSLRWDFSAVVFDDKIWIMGGRSSDGGNPWGYLNDVWYSSDGINWIEVTSAAPWAARNRHTSVTHDGKIWVLGGWAIQDVEVYFDDVWCSPDGVNWTETSDTGPWNYASQYTSVVYGGRIWLIWLYPSGSGRHIWYTVDGVTWTQATDALPWSAIVGARALTYAGEMWVIAGRNTGEGTGQYNDVWHSCDGVNWIGSDKPAAFGPRSGHGSAIFDGKLWVLGGRSSLGDSFLGDVWSSSDGVNWAQATIMVPWGLRIGHTSVAFNGSIWVIGGGVFDGRHIVEKNDVWYSSDGAQWTAVTTPAPWVRRQGHASLVHQGALWVLGGRYYEPGDDYYYGGTTYYLGDSWQSNDGQNWTQATSAGPWGPRAFHACVSYDGKIWLAGGYLQADSNITSMNDVWYSSDGTNWAQATQSASWAPRYGHALVAHDGQMWLLGGGRREGTSLQFFSDAWYSTDGANWTEAAQAADWKPRSVHTAASFDGKLWVLGGYEGSSYSLVFKDIWCAEDPRAFAFTRAPAGDWKEENESLVLSVSVQGAAGSVTYQWMKDDETLDGQTSSVLTIPSLQLSDQGYYWCIVTDESESKTAHESPRAYVQVFPAGSLPGTGLGVIALATMAMIAVGALVVRHKRSHAEPPSRSEG